MAKCTQVEIEPLLAESFAPYGQVIAQGAEPTFSGPHVSAWRMNFGADGPVDVMLNRFVHLPMEFSEMERHFNVTQSFIPLGGSPSVMVVAPPSPRKGAEGRPSPETVRAFYVEGTQGVLLWKGTWHALTRFPVRPPHADIVMITGLDTQLELEKQTSDGSVPALTEVWNFARAEGVTFKVIDPRGLIRS